MRGSNGLDTRLLASTAPATSQGLTLQTELAYLSCQVEREVPFYSQRDSEKSSENCCLEMIELLSGGFVRA